MDQDGHLLDDKVCMLIPRPSDTPVWKQHLQSDDMLTKAHQGKNGLTVVDGMVYKDNKLYVPPPLRAEALTEALNSVEACHGGDNATTHRLKAVWWPSIYNDIRRHVATCNECQLRKGERCRASGQILQHEASAPLDKLTIDHCGPIRSSLANKRFTCVAVDVFTRSVELDAMPDQLTETFTRFLLLYIGRYGAPNVLLVVL